MNYAKTMMLLAALTALFLGAGWMIGGSGGAFIAFLLALATNGFAWWNSDRLALRMHNAEPVTRMGEPELYALLERLSKNAGLPTPALYVIRSDQPNAFATGRSPEKAAVAVTTGLMRAMTTEELAGVIAHELAHIRNHDTLIMTIAATVGGAISTLAQIAQFGMLFGGGRDGENRGPLGGLGLLLAVILAPMAAMVIQMTISRTREYAADRAAAEITGQPLWLASALRKIAAFSGRVVMESAERNPASAHLFIANPLAGRRFDSLFSTHPAPENRIAALERMAAESGAGSVYGGRAAPRGDSDAGFSGGGGPRTPRVPRTRPGPWR